MTQALLDVSFEMDTSTRTAVPTPGQSPGASPGARKTRASYPDFLFFHDDGDGSVAIDLVDPHNHSLADTAPKWAALARYVREHDGDFRRAAIVIKDSGGAMLSIQLSGQIDDNLERKLAQATSKEAIEQLFRELGGAY